MNPMHRLSERRALALALALIAGGLVGCGKGESGTRQAAQGSQEKVVGETDASGPTSVLAEPNMLGKPKPTVRSTRTPGENRAPKARFEVYPLEGLANLTGITFDATFSSDEFNLSSELGHRWDFDGDGIWDTEYTHAERTSYLYPMPGHYRPRLEVRDSGGLADSIVGPEVAIHPPCPASDFALTDINPNSRSFGRAYRLSELRGKPVMAWFVAPSK